MKLQGALQLLEKLVIFFCMDQRAEQDQMDKLSFGCLLTQLRANELIAYTICGLVVCIFVAFVSHHIS